MSNKRYFSYVRVSTQRQGQNGTSLAEQQAAIIRYSQTWNLEIIKCYEERETAAKQGRRVFLEMLKALRQQKADGLVIHKIDRSARNLKDWAAIGDLIDSGIEVHFANEGLDLNSRGGRLSADIQAVVAADYIRNLREEVRKGFYGRLKQGFYPMPAPLGYLDVGKGEPKRIDTSKARLVQQAFEYYSSGRWGLYDLGDRMFEMGLKNKTGRRVSVTGLSTILHNPFYIGLIRIKKSGEMFAGRHRPILPKVLFDKVQAVFAGKNVKKADRHFFVFRRHINCIRCRKVLVPEKQKNQVYYRCHTRNCTHGTLREDTVHDEVLKNLEKLRLDKSEMSFFRQATVLERETAAIADEARTKQLHLQLEQVKDRLSKLADAYVEGVFDKETYVQKKNRLLIEEKSVREGMRNSDRNQEVVTKRLDAFLELVNSAYSCYEIGKPDERRDLVKVMTSNIVADGKSVSVKLEIPFQIMAERPSCSPGAPHREAARTNSKLIKKLVKYFSELDTSKSDDALSQYLTSKLAKKIRPTDIRNLLPKSSLSQ